MIFILKAIRHPRRRAGVWKRVSASYEFYETAGRPSGCPRKAGMTNSVCFS